MNNLKKDDLFKKCEELNIKSYKSKSKKELIDLINNFNNLEINNELIIPPLKWVGGKYFYLNYMINLLKNKEINNYYEFFIGGGSILLNILNNFKINGEINVYDINKNLIDFYNNLKNNYEELLININNYINIYNNNINKEKYFYEVRNIYNNNKNLNNINISSIFYILNKTSFRGVYRENSKGEFNVPFGNYNNISLIDKNYFNKLNKLIQNVNFINLNIIKHYNNLVIQKNDIFIIDPPYLKIKNDSFTKYNKEDFNKEDNINLFNFIKQNNINFILFNIENELIKNYFKDDCYKKIYYNSKRRINSKLPQSTEKEMIIYNFD